MHIRCPDCATFMAAGPAAEPGDAERCRFCGKHFLLTAAQIRACRRTLAAEARRERLRPVDIFASLTVFLVTAGVLLATFYSRTRLDPFTGPSIWIFAAWTTILCLTAWIVYRTGQQSFVPSLYRTSLTLLVVLAAPLLFRSLPSGPNLAFGGRGAQQLLVSTRR